MNNDHGLLDPTMSSSSGGSSGRRRGGRRVDSMIAGRRKPADDNNGGSGKSSGGGRSSSSRSSSSSNSSSGSSTSSKASSGSTASSKKSEPSARKPARRRRAAPKKAAEQSPKNVTKEEEAVAEPEQPVEEPEAAAEEPEATAAAEPVKAERPAPARSSAAKPSALVEGELPEAIQRELADLRALVEEQHSVLTELRAGLTAVADATDRAGYRPRLGIFVDVPNIMYGVEAGSDPVDMGKLLKFLSVGRELVRATAYSPVSDDPREPVEQQKFVAPFVPYDYRITTKPLKRFADGSIKGNFDVEMALDMLTMADRLDIVSIVSGDADFSRAVEAVQTRGVRVEVVAFAGSASIEMRALADRYIQLDEVIGQLI